MKNSPKSVLFIDHSPVIGGAENSLLSLMKQLQHSNHWQIYFAGTEGEFFESVLNEGIYSYLVNMPSLRQNKSAFKNWLDAVRHLNIITQKQHQILYANTVRAAFFASFAAKLSRKPFIWHMRDFWLSENEPLVPFFDSVLKYILCLLSTKVITNSQVVANYIPCSHKISVVHNGIDLNKFIEMPKNNTFRQNHGIPLQEKLVGMVGRLRPWKGQIRFLQIAKKIIDIAPTTHFVLVGGDPFLIKDGYQQQLKSILTDLNISDNIHFTGQVKDIRPALSAMDIFVHPGNPEPFGLVNIEAMAMKKPVIAFSHGALPEIVRHNKTGLLIPPYDKFKMAIAIVDLLNDSNRRIEMGENGRIIVQKYFSIQHTATKIETILNSVIE